MWTSDTAIAIYILIGVIGLAVAAYFVLHRTVRTRLQTAKQISEDPDINEWLVIFNWTNKILYVPIIVVSILAGVIVLLAPEDAHAVKTWVGGIWFAIFFINFLVEEYEINIKMLIIGAACIGLFFLWLNLLEWAGPFLRIFKHVAIELNWTAYFVIAFLGLVTIVISWVRGLFFYVAITPNYMNIQEGPTETGEHIGQEDYNSRIDTGDFLERLMGFGRVILIFKDRKRQPLVMLVWGIRQKAKYLEAIRGTISVEQHRPPDESLFPTEPEKPADDVPPAEPDKPVEAEEAKDDEPVQAEEVKDDEAVQAEEVKDDEAIGAAEVKDDAEPDAAAEDDAEDAKSDG